MSAKHLVKEVAAALMDRLGLLRRLGDPRQPLVLYFHHVSPPGRLRHYIADLTVSAATFECQISFLRDRFNVIPLEAVVHRLADGTGPSGRDLAITFDDGYLDNYTWAYPILKKHGVPATIFIATAHVGSSRPFWWQTLASLLEWAGAAGVDFERLPPDLFPAPLAGLLRRALRDPMALTGVTNYLKSLGTSPRCRILAALEEHIRPDSSQRRLPRLFLSWHEMKEMTDHGITFGSHSHTHPVLTELSDEELSRELTVSRALIQDHLGLEASAFSYPDGWADARVRTHVIGAGYKYAVQTGREFSSGSLDVYAIPRRMVKEAHARSRFGEFSGSLFAAELAGVFDRLFLRHRRARNPYRARHAPEVSA